jgi:hypothetical protein
MDIKFYHKLQDKIKNNSEGKIILSRSIAIVLLFAITVYMVYIAPIGVDKLFCALLLVMFWYSKADYFWFAFFLVINSFPAGFFSETTGDALRRLPIFSPIPKISFSILDLFLIIALIKAIVKGKKIKYWDIFKLKNIIYIFPFIFVVSLFYGITLKVFLNAPVRGLFFYTLIYSFPSLIHKEKDIYKFMLMFFPFAIVELMSQVYTINAGTQIANYFHPGALDEVYNSVTGDIRPIPDGFLSLRLGYVFAFVFLYNKNYVIPRIYPLSIIIIIISSTVISATRSATIVMVFIFVMYFIFVAKRRPNILLQIFIMLVTIVLILDFTRVLDLNNILDSSYRRFIGAVSIQGGDIKAEDSFDNRISNRLPLLIEAINKSLIIGYGFSDKYFEYLDGHLGGVPVGLLQVGIFGYIFYLVFIYNIFKKCIIYIKKLPKNNTHITTIKVFLIGFVAYLLMNFTTEPIFVLNTSTMPQDILIHLIIASLFIYLALKEQAMKKLESKKEILKLT